MMNHKKPDISSDEHALFQAAMKDVRPLHQKPNKNTQKNYINQNESGLRPSLKQANFDSEPKNSSNYFIPNFDFFSEKDWLESKDCIQFVRGGLQAKVLKRLKQGSIPIEARLDLHRLTVNQALQKIDEFIAKCQERHLRYLCIIHGKGHYSANGKPILKNALYQWVQQCPQVLACYSAKPKDGGTGAVYILLKLQKAQNHDARQ